MKTYLKTIRLSQKENKPDFMLLDYRIDHIFSSMFQNEHKYVWVHNFISAN